MSSILTNNSAMVALQTLKSINNDLGKVQSEISTGKTVESAKDNAAVWAISKVMESDVEGFKAISDSLALGDATIGVALNGAEGITDLLTEIKGKIVNSQESNVDRDKIQTDIEALSSQISSITGAAQFNGLNLLSGGGSVAILSSLDRGSDGSVTANDISVARQDLGTTAQTIAADAAFAAGSATDGAAAVTLNNATQTAAIDIAGVEAGIAFSIMLDATDLDSSTFTAADYDLTADVAGASEITYVAKEGDTAKEVGAGLKAAWDSYVADNPTTVLTADIDFTATDTGLQATSTTTTAADTMAVSVATMTSASDGMVSGGGLADLATIDVTTEDGANEALDAIEGLIQTSINSAAAFGSAGRQVETQMEFVGKLTDLLTSGIGTLVDADMEAASAKLQALQTQQQLGVQALSIANQAPQTILSLFR